MFLDLWIEDLEEGVPSLIEERVGSGVEVVKRVESGVEMAECDQDSSLVQVPVCEEDEIKSWVLEPLSEDENEVV